MPSKRTYHVRTSKDFLVIAGICFFMCIWAVHDAWFPSEKVLKKHPREVAVGFEIPGMVEYIHVGVGDAVHERQVLAGLDTKRVEEALDAAKKSYAEARAIREAAMARIQSARKEGTVADVLGPLEEAVAEAEAMLEDCHVEVEALNSRLVAATIVSPVKGKVQSVRKAIYGLVETVVAPVDGTIASFSDEQIVLTDAEGAQVEILLDTTMQRHEGVIVGSSVAAGDLLAIDPVVVINPSDHFYPFNQTLAVLMFIGFWVFIWLHFFAT